jgi:hypothetical protein
MIFTLYYFWDTYHYSLLHTIIFIIIYLTSVFYDPFSLFEYINIYLYISDRVVTSNHNQFTYIE